MPVVIDASVIVPLALDGEDVTLSEEALRVIGVEGGFVPALFWYEIRNVLLLNEPRGRTTPDRIAAFLDDVATLPLVVDFPPDSARVLELGRLYSLTVYDAAYLELALRTNSRVATHDESLRRAVLATGGQLLGA
jgi:predicted nucleic acid-binding protein